MEEEGKEFLEKQCIGRKITSLLTTKLRGMEFHKNFLQRLGELRTEGPFSGFQICCLLKY